LDRVLTVTTDNASNNNTLARELKESLLTGTSPKTSVIRVPCLAHVIQLALKQLLGQVKANPKNETNETVWSESHDDSLRRNSKNKDIAGTLAKVKPYYLI
jgi:hypothetical protein